MIPDDIAVAATPDNIDNEVDFFSPYSLKIPQLVCVDLTVTNKAGQEYREL